MARRILLFAWLAAAAFVLPVSSQAQDKQRSDETETRSEPDFKWHLANTAIFFALVGYALFKSAPGFFNARTADIQRAIQEATGLKLQAEFRSSEIDRQMATLPAAVAKLRTDAQNAMERERERRRSETEDAISRIQKSAAGEIENMRAEGSRQIRMRAARVAVRLAEQRLRERSRSVGNAESIADFVQLVNQGRN